MKMQKYKESFKLFLNQLSPKLYIRWLTTRYSVTNNMNIFLQKEYSADGTFVTMWNNPPKYYKKWLSNQHFNEKGLPMRAPDGTAKVSAVPIIQYGICEYGYYIHTRNDSHLRSAIRIADWLVDNQASNGGWLYEYDYYHPRVVETIKAPWICGMAQGEGAGFLARMYKLTGEEKYKTAAEKSLICLEIPVEKGGVYREWYGMPFFEEYPTQKPSLTLNGLIFCLIGIHDLYEICSTTKALELFEKGYDTVLKILPLYDSEHTSYYDLTHITNSPRYPQPGTKYDPLHVMLLQVLNIIKPNSILRFYIEKWSWGIIKKEDLNS